MFYNCNSTSPREIERLPGKALLLSECFVVSALGEDFLADTRQHDGCLASAEPFPQTILSEQVHLDFLVYAQLSVAGRSISLLNLFDPKQSPSRHSVRCKACLCVRTLYWRLFQPCLEVLKKLAAICLK